MNDACTWSVQPARERPGACALTIGVLVALGVLVTLIGGDWIWGALAVVFMVLVLSRFFFASQITISSDGIRAEFPLRTRSIDWNTIEWVRHDEEAALIRLERRQRFRSREFTILFGANATEAIAALQQFAPKAILSRRGGAPCEN